MPDPDVPVTDIPADLVRTNLDLPEVDQLTAVRHFTRLSKLNYSIDEGMYPLGSCTMKYNPVVNEELARLPGFATLHPLLPDALAQGALELLAALEREGKAVKVSQDLYYHSAVTARLREMIAGRIRTGGPLGAAEFRDMIQASRKFSIALLEYFDRSGFTIRVGDQRTLRKA